MSAMLPFSDTCCTPCEDVPEVQVPGAAGNDGADGADGADGVNAFTTTTANFAMPAEGATVVVSVVNSTWMALNQLLYVQNAGWMRVTAIPTSASVTLRNEENTASSLYTENVAPTTVISSGSQISPGGLQGPAGTVAGALLAANDLSDVNSAATSRSNLGLGTMAVQAANGVNITGGAITGITDIAVADGGTGASTAANARTNLGLVIGTNVQAWDADLDTVAANITAAGHALIDDASATAQRTTLGVNRTLQDYLLYEHQEATTVNGGDFTSGAWQTVPLNTEVYDTGGHGAIAASIITLAAGTYRFRGRVCGYDVDTFQSRLWNVDTGSVIAMGDVVRAAAAGDDMQYSEVRGRFTLAISTQIRLEGRCQTTNAADGFGLASSFGLAEVYSSLEIEREAG